MRTWPNIAGRMNRESLQHGMSHDCIAQSTWHGSSAHCICNMRWSPNSGAPAILHNHMGTVWVASTPYLLGQPTTRQADTSLRVHRSLYTPAIPTSAAGPCHVLPGCPCQRNTGVALLLLHPRTQTRDATSARAAVRVIHPCPRTAIL